MIGVLDKPRSSGTFALMHTLSRFYGVQRRQRAITITCCTLTILGLVLRTVGGLHPGSTTLFHGHEFSADFHSLVPSHGIDHRIPHKIWQIMLPKDPDATTAVVDPEGLRDVTSWLVLNPDYMYTLVGQGGASEFVRQNFADEPKIVETYGNLTSVGMKSDLLRYLILGLEGGVYTDTDTLALKPIDQWVPEHLRDQVRLIVGIEFDRRDDDGWPEMSHWLQFCQWTIAAAPGHPVFRRMVSRVMDSVDQLSEEHQVPVHELLPSSFEVLNSTGPAAWTDVVFEQLQEYDPLLKETRDLSFMTEPKLYGDILVLHIDGFGMGQPHSHSTDDGSIPDGALARHFFRGTWRLDDERQSF